MGRMGIRDATAAYSTDDMFQRAQELTVIADDKSLPMDERLSAATQSIAVLLALIERGWSR